MLNINGDLKSGFSSPKPAASVHRNHQERGQSRMMSNESVHPVVEPKQVAASKYRKSMVFSIEMNEDEEVADEIRKKPFTIPIVRVELSVETGPNKLASSRVPTDI